MCLKGVELVERHVRKYLLAYLILAMALALVTESITHVAEGMSRASYSQLIKVLAIVTILPSMVLLRGEEIGEVAKLWRESLLTIVYVYVLTPILTCLFASMFRDKLVGAGFFVANLVPASSASLGYVMLASGNIELATMLIVLLVVLAIPVIPGYLTLYSSLSSVSIPVGSVIESLILVLVAPLIIGQVVRYALRRRKGATYVENELKPFLSLTTMLSMLVLVALLVARKEAVLLTKPLLGVEIFVLQLIIVLALIGVTVAVNRLLGITYEEHQAMTFVAITKNQSVAAAIAASNMGGAATIPPALIPVIQPVLAITYLHLEHVVRSALKPSRVSSSVKNPRTPPVIDVLGRNYLSSERM